MSRTWRTSPSLLQLNREIKQLYPQRSTRSDGFVGDLSHQARPSAHNPDPDGWVRAGDWTTLDTKGRQIPGFADRIVAAAIKHPAALLVIHNRSIWSRNHGWRKRHYTGSNPHLDHVHVSILNNVEGSFGAAALAEAAASVRPWLTTTTTAPATETKGILAMDINQPVPGTEKLSTDGKPLTAGQCLLRGAWAYQHTINTGSIAQRLRRVEALVKARTSPTGEARAQYAYDTVTGDDSLVARLDALEAALMESDDDLTGI